MSRRTGDNVRRGRDARTLPAAVYLYVGATVAFAAVAFAAASLVLDDRSLPRLWVLGLFAVLVALEHVLAIRLSKRHQGESLAHEEALLVFMALLLPPFAALATFAVGVLAGHVARPHDRLKAVFNVAQFVGSAALAFFAIGALTPVGGSAEGELLAVLAGVLVFSVANHALVAGVLAVTGACSLRSGLLEDIAPRALVWTGTVSIGLLGGLVALAEPWALPFALAAMIPLSLAFSGHARARRKRQMLQELVEEVSESEARLRLALDAGGMGSWEWDMASGEVRWSENLERIYGLPPGGFGGTYEEFVARTHPEDRELLDVANDRALVEGRVEAVFRILRADGAVRWIEDKARVLLDEDGRPRGMAGVACDVTERKRTEALAGIQRRVLERIATGAELDDVLELLTRLVEEESGEVLAAVLVRDEDGCRLGVGAAPSLPLGYADAVAGLTLEPSTLSSDLRHVTSTLGLGACWSASIAAASGDVLGAFAMHYRREQEPLASDLELGEAAVHLAAVALDRDRQAGRLSTAQESYRRLVESLPLAVYAFAPEREATRLRARGRYFSPRIEDILGYSPEEWLADPELYAKVLHPDDRDRILAEVRSARAAAGGFRGEYRMVAKDGRTVWVHDESVYLRGADGAVSEVEGYLVDVSDRKELEEDLLQAQKLEAIGQLSGGIAHDFNNLMTAVIGFSELALRRAGEDEPLRAQLEQIHRAGERASSMTNQLLAFSRKQVLQTRVLDLNAVVADAERLLTRLIGEDVELACVLDPGLAPIEADPVQLEQVIVNLAVNARDAMPLGGRLTIETANVELGPDDGALELEPGPYVRLSVADTGVGIDPETRARIFEPFFTTKEEGRGTGLGLATVFGIVKQSGGHITTDSEPGEGTVFRIHLPVTAVTVEPDESPAVVESWPGGSETVLVVDDEEGVRSLERAVLADCGYTVLEARHAREALELAATHAGPIDLLLTDVVMPEVGGPELAARLARSQRRMKVLYTSGYADDAVMRHGVLDPGIAFLPKPLTPAALAAKVREVLEARSKQEVAT